MGTIADIEPFSSAGPRAQSTRVAVRRMKKVHYPDLERTAPWSAAARRGRAATPLASGTPRGLQGQPDGAGHRRPGQGPDVAAGPCFLDRDPDRGLELGLAEQA